MDEATSSVNALVSDEPQGEVTQSSSMRSAVHGQTTPLGIVSHREHPEVALGSGLAPNSSQSSKVVSAMPIDPSLRHDHGPAMPERTPLKTAPGSALGVVEKPARATSSPAQQRRSRGSATLQVEDFPALDAPRLKEPQPVSPAIPSVPTPKGKPAPKRPGERSSARPSGKAVMSPVATSGPVFESPNTKHDIVHADMTKSAVSLAEHSSKSDGSTDHSVMLPPPLSYLSGTASSPMQRAPPRSIRVMPPAKAEAVALPSPTHSTASKAVSLSLVQDVPWNEGVSDTASVRSASLSASRTGSPPPSRIGSATVRSTTRSQQRKQRKEAIKQEAKVISEAAKAEPEEHAPVVGRKKKQKKEKPTRATPPGVDAVPKDPATGKRPAVEGISQEKSAPEKASETELRSKTSPQKKLGKGKGKAKDKDREKGEKEAFVTAPWQPPEPLPVEPPPPSQPAGSEKPHPGPSSVFAEIRDSLWTAAVDRLAIFRLLAGSSSRPEPGSGGQAQLGGRPALCKDCSCKCGEIHDDDLAALSAGRPVRKQLHVDGSRMLITPNGDCIRGLTREEEDTFLDLQAAIAAMAENPGAFVAPRHQPGSGAFSLIKGRAVPNGRPSIFPAAARPQAQDPIGKLQREDALSYINQYVLPRLNLGAAGAGLPHGASPLRDSAAASLNSLAPYFYGPDAAAGVGIYSAPEGARAAHDFAPPKPAAGPGGAPVAGPPPRRHGGCGDDDDGGAGGFKMSRSGAGMPLMSVDDAEAALASARRETDKLEKGLNAVIKRNRRLLLGGGA